MTDSALFYYPVYRSLIIKIASHCNLNCQYCYIYNKGDLTYRMLPKVMSLETVSAILQKVRSYCKQHGLTRFTIIFHGGEPLLVKPFFFEEFMRLARVYLQEIDISYSLQTNGILLSTAWCRLFQKLNIRIGISLDGPKEVNDALRVDKKGRGSYCNVVQGMKIAQAANLSFGILQVIDPEAPPEEVYQHLEELQIEHVNFLFPYGTWDRPPKGTGKSDHTSPYGDWLIAIYEIWFHKERGRPRVKLFEEIIRLLLDKGTGSEALGSGDNAFVVIETDGSIEPSGALKVCSPGITKLGLNIHQDSLEAVLDTAIGHQYYFGHTHLNTKCKGCTLKKICGGGQLAHRYSADNGFDNPSVLCKDITKLINHIQQSLEVLTLSH